MRSKLDTEKAVEVLLYVSARVNGDVYASLKAIYHAEKFHLENYGSQIYGEKFYALEHGPVPSFAYDITKSLSSGKKIADMDSCNNFEGAFDPDKCSSRRLTSAREANHTYLSESDLESLNHGTSMCVGKSFSQLKDDSHDDAYLATTSNSAMAIETIASILPDGAMINQHLKRHQSDSWDGD